VDTDGDGFSDFEEVTEFFTDPLDAESTPGGSKLSWILLFIALVIITSGSLYFGYTQYYMDEPLKLPPIGSGAPAPKQGMGNFFDDLSKAVLGKKPLPSREMFKSFDKRPVSDLKMARPAAPLPVKPKTDEPKGDALSALKEMTTEKKKVPSKDVFDDLSKVNEKKAAPKDAMEELTELAKKKKKK
jgi:Bacterial TSP3 repeat